MTEKGPRDPQEKRDRGRPTASAILSAGAFVEMLHRPESEKTLLCVYADGKTTIEPSIIERETRLVPYSPQNNLLVHEVVLFPSDAVEYGTEEELVAEIQAFIHAHVDISPVFETIASYYVLFSWIYDSFNEMPYLRFRGDTGSGKTRCLLIIGSLCYKPMFASGASTVSPIFRILDAFQGTLIVDEGDFRFSDEKADIIKILNNGNARGFPVLRSEAMNNGKEFDPRAYSVFGPKIIATRHYFEDRALETRCLTEETGGRKLRGDIPLNLPADWKQRARTLRNKLLMFRFRNFGQRQLDPTNVDRSIEPRLAQLFGPLLAVIRDSAVRNALGEIARAYDRDLANDRGFEIEAQVLELIRDLKAAAPAEPITVKEVTRHFASRYGAEYDRKITCKWIGIILRQNLQLKTQKTNGNYALVPGQAPKLTRLFERYGVSTAADGDIDVSDKTPS